MMINQYAAREDGTGSSDDAAHEAYFGSFGERGIGELAAPKVFFHFCSKNSINTHGVFRFLEKANNIVITILSQRRKKRIFSLAFHPFHETFERGHVYMTKQVRAERRRLPVPAKFKLKKVQDEDIKILTSEFCFVLHAVCLQHSGCVRSFPVEYTYTRNDLLSFNRKAHSRIKSRSLCRCFSIDLMKNLF
jgi:hypothetical protein